MNFLYNKLTRKLIVMMLFMFSFYNLSGQALPFYDGLNYTVGQGLQTQSGWTILNNGDDLAIASGSLTYPGLPASTGNKVTFAGAGIDSARAFAQQTSGTVYYSFLLNISALGSLGTSGSYFTGFTEGANTTFGATVWLRADGTGYDIGISPKTTAANTVWSSGTTSLNTTIMVVVSYQIVSGTLNDVVKMWINPTVGGTEPTATLTATNTAADLANISRILIRQDSASNTPFVEMDELRVGTSWASVAPSGISISATGTLSALDTTYGTVSSNTSFEVSGSNLSEGITITPPFGFEVSTLPDFSANVGTSITPLIIGVAGEVPLTTIFVRLGIANAGVYNGNIVLTSSGAPTINKVTNSVNNINQKELTIVGLTADDKIFDNTTVATLTGTPSLSGVVSGDESNVSLIGTYVANFSDAAVGVDKPVTVTGYSITGFSSLNYFLVQPSGLIADILPSGLQDQVITFGALSSATYGDSDFNLTATSDSGLVVTYSSSNTDVATVSGNVVTIVGAGSTVITASQTGNSSYNPATPVAQTLTINQKALSVIGAIANDKEYDSGFIATVTGGTLVGVINSDDVAFTSTGVFADFNVGSGIAVSATHSLSGLDASNYIVSVSSLSASITPKEITVIGISISNKEFDTTNGASIVGTPTLSGVFFSDFANLTLEGTPSAFFNDASVGTNKPIIVSGYSITGSASGNYFLVQPTGLVADITLRSLTIIGLTANDKVYDRNTDVTLSGTASLSGILPGDELNVSLDGTPVATFDTSSAGISKPVSVLGYSISGSSIANYALVSLILNATITQKEVTITSASVSDKLYDGTTTANLSGVLDGVLSPDDVVLTLSAEFNNAFVGNSKPVTSTSTLSGAEANNYSLIQPTGLVASITPGTCTASSGDVTWNFVSASPSNYTSTGIIVSSLSQGNNNGFTTLITSTSPSNYVGASASQNASAAVFVAPFNASSSTYFEFTVTPQAGYNVGLSALTFGSRSTNTGPKAYTLRSSIDGYVSDLATGTLLNNSIWVLLNPTLLSNPTSNSPIVYRLYGHSGAGAPGLGSPNWKIDDLKLTLTVTPGLVLSSPNTNSICTGELFNYTPTTIHEGSVFTWTRDAVVGISNAAVTIPQTTNPSEILVNTTNAPIDVVYQYTVTTNTCFTLQNVTVTVNPMPTWYEDFDNDGFGNALVTQVSCTQPIGYVADNLDCNDNAYSLTNSCSSIVNLKLLVEGYYDGSGTMKPVKNNQDFVSPMTDVTDIIVELYDETTFALVATTTAVLKTDGTAVCTFTNAPSGLFYLTVKANNMIQTWTANPVLVGSTPLLYDFSDASNKAFADNMIQIEAGVWAFYSGDLNSDGSIDNTDYSLWETDANNFAFGVFATDLNGDGSVDNTDYSIWETNANNFVFSISPIIP